MFSAQEWIDHLGLVSHTEGGYFRRIYTSVQTVVLENGDVRPAMTSIDYLLTREQPVSYFARNRADILHFHQRGGPLVYHLVDANGHYERAVLSSDPLQGQARLTVRGNTWKACELVEGDFALICEVVCPGFDYADMRLAAQADLADASSSLPATWRRWIKPTPDGSPAGSPHP